MGEDVKVEVDVSPALGFGGKVGCELFWGEGVWRRARGSRVHGEAVLFQADTLLLL